MRAWIENDDDITPFIELDVYDEDGTLIEAHGIQCRPLPWRIELDADEIRDAVYVDWFYDEEQGEL